MSSATKEGRQERQVSFPYVVRFMSVLSHMVQVVGSTASQIHIWHSFYVGVIPYGTSGRIRCGTDVLQANWEIWKTALNCYQVCRRHLWILMQGLLQASVRTLSGENKAKQDETSDSPHHKNVEMTLKEPRRVRNDIAAQSAHALIRSYSEAETAATKWGCVWRRNSPVILQFFPRPGRRQGTEPCKMRGP